MVSAGELSGWGDPLVIFFKRFNNKCQTKGIVWTLLKRDWKGRNWEKHLWARNGESLRAIWKGLRASN